MKANTVQQAAEMAADFIFHFMEEMGSEKNDAINAASQIYKYITDTSLDVEGVLGVSL